IVQRGEFHPALYADTLSAVELSWASGEFSFPLPYVCQAKVRYRQKDQACVITSIQNGRLEVQFATPQRAITPRQSVVFYQQGRCLGGGMIEGPGPSYYQMKKELPKDLTPDLPTDQDH
ncbi:MAG: aminomethyltransferase beta-barrel domain-containing protein, partial [Pseudomonadota bacterium]